MLITLTIIFGVGSAAGAFFFWRERKSRMIYERSYRALTKDYAELRHSHGVIIRDGGSWADYQRRVALKTATAIALGILTILILRRRKSENES